MTQPLGQRGGQPLYYPLKSTPHNAGRIGKGQQQAASAASNVKFGGVVDTVCSSLAQAVPKVVPVSVFEKINEVFLAGFLAQDVVAMWLPRVWTSLKTGREHYEPNDDPQARHLSFHEQAKKWAIENYKGLNWVNFNEETKREFATGPGLLAVPAFIFLGNRYLGNTAKELSYPSLKGLGLGFSEHLAKNAPANEAEFWGKTVPDYIASLFVDPKLEQEKAKEIRDWSQRWAAELKKQTNRSRWDRAGESVSRFFKKSGPTTLETLSKELNETIRTFNRSSDERTLAYAENAVIQDSAPLHHAEHTWISYRPHSYTEALNEAKADQAKALCHQVPVGHVTGDLNRFGGLVKSIWQKYQSNEGKTAISVVAEHTMKKLAGHKLLLGAGTTLLTALYLLRLAFWAQNHSSYQAVRLLKEDALKGRKGHHAQQSQQPHGADPHLQAGLPFGAQPAFLSQGPVYAPLQAAFRGPAAPAANPFAPKYPAMSTGFRGRQPNQPPIDWRHG